MTTDVWVYLTRFGFHSSGYFRVQHCVRERAAAFPAVCPSKLVETNVQYVRGFFDNAVDVICGEFNDTTDRCERVPLVPVKRKSKKRPKSFFNPLVKLLSQL